MTPQAEELLHRVRLTDSASIRTVSYSGGMKRRLSVAMAMLGNPKVPIPSSSPPCRPSHARTQWHCTSRPCQRRQSGVCILGVCVCGGGGGGGGGALTAAAVSIGAKSLRGSGN